MMKTVAQSLDWWRQALEQGRLEKLSDDEFTEMQDLSSSWDT